MSTQKTTLGGRPISRKEAFKGLGSPKTWKKFSDAVYAEFRAKPKNRKLESTVLQASVAKLRAVIQRRRTKPAETVYAKRTKRKAATKRAGSSKRRSK